MCIWHCCGDSSVTCKRHITRPSQVGSSYANNTWRACNVHHACVTMLRASGVNSTLHASHATQRPHLSHKPYPATSLAYHVCHPWEAHRVVSCATQVRQQAAWQACSANLDARLAQHGTVTSAAQHSNYTYSVSCADLHASSTTWSHASGMQHGTPRAPGTGISYHRRVGAPSIPELCTLALSDDGQDVH